MSKVRNDGILETGMTYYIYLMLLPCNAFDARSSIFTCGLVEWLVLVLGFEIVQLDACKLHDSGRIIYKAKTRTSIYKNDSFSYNQCFFKF